MWSVCLRWLRAIAVLAGAPAVLAAPMFSMTEVVGPFGERRVDCVLVGFNDAGQSLMTCGYSVYVSAVGGGWVYVPPPPLPKVFGVEARGLNADGTVVAFFRQPHGHRGGYTWHPTRGMVMLKAPPGAERWEPNAINDAGEVAGSLRGRRRPAIWLADGSLAPNQPRLLPPPVAGEATVINNSGEMIINIRSNQDGDWRKGVARWSAEHGARRLVMQDGRKALGATDMNDSGLIFGTFVDNGHWLTVFVADRQGRYMVLDDAYKVWYPEPTRGDINDVGQAVWNESTHEYFLFKYRDLSSDAALPLFDLIDPSSPWLPQISDLLRARLNNHGQIMVTARMTDRTMRFFLLNPMAH